MATSRAVNQILRQKRFLYNLPTIPIGCSKFPSHSQVFYSNQSQNMPTKSDQSNSRNQIQTGFAEVGKRFFYLFFLYFLSKKIKKREF